MYLIKTHFSQITHFEGNINITLPEYNEIEMIYFNHFTTDEEIKSFVFFPKNLKRLYIFDNDIETLPDLPASLEVLSLNNTKIDPSKTNIHLLPSCETTIKHKSTSSVLSNTGQSRIIIQEHSKTYIYLNDNNDGMTPIDIPDYIENVIIQNSRIDTLPKLPSKLVNLTITKTNITKLEGLPDTLFLLNVSNNKIKYIDKFPSKLEKIDISSNLLETIPMIPTSVVNFTCSCNKLTIFPKPSVAMKTYCASRNKFIEPIVIDLRDGGYVLEELKLSECGNVIIVSLPKTIKRLSLYKCNLKFLTDFISREPYIQRDRKLAYSQMIKYEIEVEHIFPNSLRYLNIAGNNLPHIPALPFNVEELVLHNNDLSTLPILTPKIKYLLCSNNKISNLDVLPKSLKYIYCDDFVKLNCKLDDNVMIRRKSSKCV